MQSHGGDDEVYNNDPEYFNQPDPSYEPRCHAQKEDCEGWDGDPDWHEGGYFDNDGQYVRCDETTDDDDDGGDDDDQSGYGQIGVGSSGYDWNAQYC